MVHFEIKFVNLCAQFFFVIYATIQLSLKSNYNFV